MPYLFTCPHCLTKTEVEDRFSGQSGQCVTCGEAITMPHFATGSMALPAAKKSVNAGWVVASIVSVIILGCLLFAMVRLGGQTMNRLTTNRERTTSIKNLEKIAEALNEYAATHGAYPPLYSRDAAGKPLHSWRVLILPFLDEEDLYNQFDLDRPWDHPTNMQVAYDIPTVYQHPNGAVQNSPYETGYYLIAGPGTLFPKGAPLGPKNISDDPSQTILVIEGTPIVASGMWSEPVDLDFTKMQGILTTNPGIEPGGLLDDGVAFATSDGRGHFVPDTIDPMVLRSLITPRGGERLADDTLD